MNRILRKVVGWLLGISGMGILCWLGAATDLKHPENNDLGFQWALVGASFVLMLIGGLTIPKKIPKKQLDENDTL